MKRIIYAILLLLCAGAIGQKSMAQSTPLYAVSPFDDSLFVIDTVDYSIIQGMAITIPGSTATGANGFTVDPCSGTFYAIVKESSTTGRLLCTMDVATGVATVIGNTGDNFASIAYTTDGRLFGVTGDGGTVSETLFQIDPATGTPTQVAALGNGNDGENIQWCPDNGFLYHWSGRNGTNGVMEKVDPNTGAVTSVTRTGYDYDEVFGSVYVGGGKFLLTNLDQEYVIVDTSGFAVLDSGFSSNNYHRGMAFTSPYVLDVTIQDTICQNEMLSVGINGASQDSVIIDYGDGTTEVLGGVDSTFMHMYASQGNKTVTIISENPLCGRDTTTFAVRVQNIPGVAIAQGATAFYCPGDSVQLNASSGGMSQWYMNGVVIPGATTNSYMAFAPGTYNMIKTNQNGCSDSAATGIMVMPAPALTVTAPPSFCEGDTAMLVAPAGGVGYQWYDNGTAIAGATSASYMSLAGGAFTVAVTWNNDGCTDSTSSAIVVLMDSIPVAAFTQDLNTALVGQTVTFTNGSMGGGTSSWTFGDGNNSALPSPTHSYNTQGTYTVTLTVSDSCGSDTATSTVVVQDSPVGLNPATELIAQVSQYPNPFEDITRISFTLTEGSDMNIGVFNLLGERVATLATGPMQAGTHTLSWDAQKQSAGMYICRIETPKGAVFLRMELMR